MRTIKLIFFLSLMCVGSDAYAQQEGYDLIKLTRKEGLPSNVCQSLLTDSKGFLWITTYNGLSRFDGSRFTNYTAADGLGDNVLYNIREDPWGRIWTVTTKTVARYTGRWPLAFESTPLPESIVGYNTIAPGVDSNGEYK